jgi:hypothetical protein
LEIRYQEQAIHFTIALEITHDIIATRNIQGDDIHKLADAQRYLTTEVRIGEIDVCKQSKPLESNSWQADEVIHAKVEKL